MPVSSSALPALPLPDVAEDLTHDPPDRRLLSRSLPGGLPARHPLVAALWQHRHFCCGLGGRLRLPSGGVWSGEDHCLAAVRELHEEVGLTVAPDDLHLVSTFKGPYGMNYLYEAELATKPNLVVDRREIVAANFAPADMARERHQFVRRYLKARARLMRR
jgi:8-oxo-dGTP pyrophosphatase MutT (NUDIX family)